MHGTSLLTTFPVVRFEGTDGTWYSQILEDILESLICSSDHRTEVKEKVLLDLFMDFNKPAVAGLRSQSKTEHSRNY